MSKKRLLSPSSLLGFSLFLAFGLRIYRLGAKSLWKDEIFSLIRSSQSFFEIILEKFPYEARAPLHHLFIHLALFFSDSEFAVRLPGVVLGVFSLFLIYKIAVVLFDDQKLGAVAAFLLAISPLHLEYSREARFYVYLIFFSSLSLLFLLKFFKEKRWRWFFYFAAVAFLSLATHPTALLILSVQFAFLAIVLFKKRALSLSWFKGGLVNNKRTLVLRLIFLLFLAVLAVVFIWSFKVLFKNIELKPDRPFAEFVSYVSESLTGSRLAILPYWLFFIIGWFSYLKKRKVEAIFLFFLTFFPPLLLYFLRAWGFGFHIRYVIFILIPYFLMVSYGIAHLLKRDINILMMAVIFISLSIQPMRAYYQTSRGDWRGVAAYIRENAQRGDVVIADGNYNKILIDYYLRSAENGLIIKTASESLKPQEAPFRIYFLQHDYVTKDKKANPEGIALIDFEKIVAFDPDAKISPMYLFVSQPIWFWREGETGFFGSKGWGVSDFWGQKIIASDALVSPGASTSYKINILVDGNYDLYVNLRWGGARGLLRYKVDNRRWSEGFQPFYGEKGDVSRLKWKEKNLGTYYLRKGEHIITFVNQKAPDGVGRYQDIDYFYLTLND